MEGDEGSAGPSTSSVDAPGTVASKPNPIPERNARKAAKAVAEPASEGAAIDAGGPQSPALQQKWAALAAAAGGSAEEDDMEWGEELDDTSDVSCTGVAVSGSQAASPVRAEEQPPAPTSRP